MRRVLNILIVPLSQDRYYEPIPDVCEISYTVTENTSSRTSVSFAINPAPLTTVRADISEQLRLVLESRSDFLDKPYI